MSRGHRAPQRDDDGSVGGERDRFSLEDGSANPRGREVPEPWACPVCAGRLLEHAPSAWECAACACAYPIENGVPRFVAGPNYAESFAIEWSAFRRTQHDSATGHSVFRERFVSTTGWELAALRGARVLEVGCGAGPFQEIVADAGGESFGIDLSGAVDACRLNHAARPNVHLAMADAFQPPFADRSFDFVFSIGVLHHTPDPRAAFLRIARLVRPGGRIAIWVYHRLPGGLIRPADLLRILLTSHLPPRAVLAACRRFAPAAGGLKRLLGETPIAGRALSKAIPVADYHGRIELPDALLREWEILDTFDMLTPAHVKPQTPRAVLGWFEEAGLVEIQRNATRPLSGGIAVSGRVPVR